MSDLNLASALTNQKPISADVSITEVKNLGMIDLRGDASDKTFVAAIKKSLGCALPITPRTATNSKGTNCLWLSPDQWLITCSADKTGNILVDLDKALSDVHSLAVDVSDMRSVISLKGDGVKEILMKGASVDLTLTECKAGYVRRLLFAEQAALIHVVSQNPDCIDLYVFRSYADYVWKWLAMTSKPAAKVELFTKQYGFEI